MIDSSGNIHTQSDKTIGPKTAEHQGALQRGDEPDGAVSGALVEVIAPFNGAGMSDDNGFFAVPYALWPCPGVQAFTSTSTIIYFGMRHFNPKGTRPVMYPLIFNFRKILD